MIKDVEINKSTYASGFEKFEAGTPPIAQVIGLSASLDFLKNLDLDVIFKHEMFLHDYMLEKLKSFNEIDIYGSSKNKGAIISFNIKNSHYNDVAFLLPGLLGIGVSSYETASTVKDSLSLEKYEVLYDELVPFQDVPEDQMTFQELQAYIEGKARKNLIDDSPEYNRWKKVNNAKKAKPEIAKNFTLTPASQATVKPPAAINNAVPRSG